MSEHTFFSYEAGRRAPQRETLQRLMRAMQLDGATSNGILGAAGFAPEWPPWLVSADVRRRPLSDLPAELAVFPWPCLGFNERFELECWNPAAVTVGEYDFAHLREPRQRNLLRIAAMRHFYERALNWHDVVSVLVGMYKNHHLGTEDLGEGSPYFRAVVDDILASDAERLGELIDLWQHTPPHPHVSRFTFPVRWQARHRRPQASR